jgi:hypothetical protein
MYVSLLIGQNSENKIPLAGGREYIEIEGQINKIPKTHKITNTI